MNLLNEGNGSWFMTRKWNIINNQSNANYDVGHEITYNTKVLKSSLCDYNDASSVVSGDISVLSENNETWVALKICLSFI